jgi:cobyrinic acid a,c-diamide synthase
MDYPNSKRWVIIKNFMNNYPRVVIAGVRGGSGKTTLSLSLIAALRYKGLSAIPFKKGPDYIDAGWISAAARNPCYNLDPFLIPNKQKILESFVSHFKGDIAVIEGNRGLYDGMDTEGSYSTAELAKLLKSSVILIVDCTKMTRTAAAVVLGCLRMDEEVMIKGVVINQVSGSRHESVVRSSIEKYCSLPVLGAIPRLESGLPERHMGLTPHQEHYDTENAISLMEEIARKYIDIDRILKIAMETEPLNDRNALCHAPPITHHEVRIGVIRDSAFQFYYPENIEELEKNGAEIIEINAIEADRLPDIDALYIGGGFPETNAIRLAENVKFKDSVRKAAESGLPIYAECGGLMFLGQSIISNGRRHPMVGIFPITFEMKKKPQAHGYTIIEVEKENPFYPIGTELRGHEFHYSAVNRTEEQNLLPSNRTSEHIYFAFKMKRGQGIADKMDGICYKNVLASYTHIHAYGAEEWVRGLINKAKEYKLVHGK